MFGVAVEGAKSEKPGIFKKQVDYLQPQIVVGL